MREGLHTKLILREIKKKTNGEKERYDLENVWGYQKTTVRHSIETETRAQQVRQGDVEKLRRENRALGVQQKLGGRPI